MTDFARKVTEQKLATEQGVKAIQLGQHILALIRKGEIVSDPTLNVIYVDGALQVVRMDFISLVSAEVFEEFIEIYALGYKVCPKCSAEMEQYITKTDSRIGIIWNWICPKCKYMDSKGWISERPKNDPQKD